MAAWLACIDFEGDVELDGGLGRTGREWVIAAAMAALANPESDPWNGVFLPATLRPHEWLRGARVGAPLSGRGGAAERNDS